MNEALRSYSQNSEDLLLSPYFDHEGENHILEIGAWFPDEFSNSRFFIEHGWHAVLVEVSPLPLDRLVRAYADNPKVKVVSTAVTPCDQHIVKLHITEDALSSSNPAAPARWKGMRPDYDGGFYGTMWAKTTPIGAIFEQFYSDRRPDIVSLDVEGGSVELFVAMINLGIRPKGIIVEHDGRQVEIWNALKAVGAHYVAVDTTQENMVLVKQ